MSYITDPDTALLRISQNEVHTLRMAYTGVHVFGATGSGKTSGSGKAICEAYLRANMGGLLFCAKPQAVEEAWQLCKANGRAGSVIFFDEYQQYNPIAHELEKHGFNGLGTVTECVTRIVEASDAAVGTTGRASDDPFWPKAIRQKIDKAIPIIYSAEGTVSIPAIADFVTSTARSAKQYLEEPFASNSYAARTLRRAVDNPRIALPTDLHDTALSYWFREDPAVPDKTHGNVQISVTTTLDRFRSGRMRRLFCQGNTVLPEMMFHGAIIILALPVLTLREDALIAAHIWKYMAQRTIEGRNGLAPAQRERPVFLWMDEAHYFLSERDDEFLSTCRDSRACVVALSQSLPSYYARLGKDKTDAADGLIGKFGTHIFHLNPDPRTNQWASQLIGRDLVYRATQNRGVGRNWSRGLNEGGSTNTSRGSSSSHGSQWSGNGGGGNHSSGSNTSSGSGSSWGGNVGSGHNENTSWGVSEQMDNIIEPRFFASELLNGGPLNGNIVSGIWFRAGARFRDGNGGNFLQVRFRQ